MPASPPLLSLKNVALRFGGPPLLDDVELTVGEGERLALVGRNGSGKSTLLKIAAGADRAGPRRARAPRRAPPCATCRRSRTFPASPTTLAYVEAGLAPGDDPLPRAISARRARPHRRGGARRTFPAARRGGRRSPARWRRSPTCSSSTSRPTISTCRRSNGWRRSSRGTRSAIVLVSHDRRFLHNAVARHAVARPRHDPPPRARLRRFRGMARRSVRAGGARPPEARPQDRRGGRLGALRRDGAARAQPGPACARCRSCGGSGASSGASSGAVKFTVTARRSFRQARHRGEGHVARRSAAAR